MAYLGKTPSQAVRSRYYYTATGGETSLSGSDDNSNVLTFTDGNYVDVSLNGVALVAGTDYNTTTTNTIGGLTALVASDVVEVIVYDTFSVFGGNMAADLNFKDNVKANFGTGNDLQIFHDGSNSIIRDAGTGSLKFQYGTSDGVVFDSSGNVGIGTASPARKLHIAGSHIRVDDGYGLEGSGSTDKFVINNDYLTMFTASSERVRIDSSGNVGIGTSSPSGLLHLSANTATTTLPSIVFQDTGTTSTRLGSLTNDNGDFVLAMTSSLTDLRSAITLFDDRKITFATSGTERMRIDSSGNVIIGSGGLDVSGIGGTYTALNMRAGAGYPVIYGQTTATTTNSPAMQIVGATSGASAGGAAEFLGIIQIAAESDSSTNGAGYMNFYTGSGGSVAERMRIDSSGNVLVGHTSRSAHGMLMDSATLRAFR